jgi:hypothetical protein
MEEEEDLDGEDLVNGTAAGAVNGGD